MQLERTSWSTPSGLRVKIPLEEIAGEMDFFRPSEMNPIEFLALRVDNSYQLSRALRTIFLFVAFFQTGNSWLSLVFAVAGFLIGYGYMFLQDYFPISTLVDFLGAIYDYLFRFFFIIPIAIIVTAVVTESYLLIAAYALSLIATFLLRFLVDILYIKLTIRRHGVALSPVDAKAARVAYRYGKSKRNVGFRAFYRNLILYSDIV